MCFLGMIWFLVYWLMFFVLMIFFVVLYLVYFGNFQVVGILVGMVVKVKIQEVDFKVKILEGFLLQEVDVYLVGLSD